MQIEHVPQVRRILALVLDFERLVRLFVVVLTVDHFLVCYFGEQFLGRLRILEAEAIEIQHTEAHLEGGRE